MGPVVAWPSGKGYCTQSSQRAWESPKVLKISAFSALAHNSGHHPIAPQTKPGCISGHSPLLAGTMGGALGWVGGGFKGLSVARRGLFGGSLGALRVLLRDS